MNFKDMDLAFVDLETTGRDFEHEIMEIGLVRASGFNFSLIDEWEVKVKPKHIETADRESLKIAHYKEEDWKDAVELEDALKIFLKKTENTILVAHNLVFDWFYIHKALKDCGLTPAFWIKGLDTVSLAWLALRNNPKIKTLSFPELMRNFDIDPGKLHSAMDDARNTYKVFLKIMGK